MSLRMNEGVQAPDSLFRVEFSPTGPTVLLATVLIPRGDKGCVCPQILLGFKDVDTSVE